MRSHAHFCGVFFFIAAETGASTSAESAEKEETEKEKPNEDPWDILFARAEGLHAHGHGFEACTLAVRLALELLASPPNLMIELPQMPTKGKRRKVSIRFFFLRGEKYRLGLIMRISL